MAKLHTKITVNCRLHQKTTAKPWFGHQAWWTLEFWLSHQPFCLCCCAGNCFVHVAELIFRAIAWWWWQQLYITLHSHQSLLPIQCAMPGTPFKHAYTMCNAPIKHLSHGYTVSSHLCHGYKVLRLGVPSNTFAMNTRCYTCHGYKVLCLAVPSNTFATETRCYAWQSH